MTHTITSEEEYITPQCFDAAVALANYINQARDNLHKAQTLADKLALKRDIGRMQAARRVILGVQ